MKKTTYKCDVCKNPIRGEHQKLYMAKVTIEGYSYNYDGGSENFKEEYHVHNDFSNHCLGKIWEILNQCKLESKVGA